MNYQEMTDFEINKAVADKLGYAGRTSRHPQLEDVVLISSSHGGFIRDYCNTWDLAGKIAQDNGISLSWMGDTWSSSALSGWDNVSSWEAIKVTHPNPRRAICIVFLMMKGGE